MIVGIEEELRVVLDPELPDVLAKVDLVTQTDGSLHVVDFKTSRSRWSDEQAKEAGDLPVTPHEVLPREQDLETMSAVSVDFRLPHPITAVEDNASCVLLIDPMPGARRLAEHRLFIDCVPLDGDERRDGDGPLERALCESLKAVSVEGVYAVTLGRISCPAQRAGSWLATGEVLWVVTGTTTRRHTAAADFHALPEPASTAMLHAALRNAMTAIEEVIALGRGDIAMPPT